MSYNPQFVKIATMRAMYKRADDYNEFPRGFRDEPPKGNTATQAAPRPAPRPAPKPGRNPSPPVDKNPWTDSLRKALDEVNPERNTGDSEVRTLVMQEIANRQDKYKDPSNLGFKTVGERDKWIRGSVSTAGQAKEDIRRENDQADFVHMSRALAQLNPVTAGGVALYDAYKEPDKREAAKALAGHAAAHKFIPGPVAGLAELAKGPNRTGKVTRDLKGGLPGDASGSYQSFRRMMVGER